MKSLKDILQHISVIDTKGSTDKKISGIFQDSRQVTEGSLFVAVKGTQVDGHTFISKALGSGATVVIHQDELDDYQSDVTYLRVENAAKTLGQVAAAFYDFPSDKLKLVGITGTNGKTSSVTILFQLFRELGYNVGLLSTVENKINEEVIPSTHTTPDPVSLNQLLAQMVKEQCTHCFMEVSSHAIEQERIAGLSFNVGLFTNISHDHLDYHKTFEAYIKAKKAFFDQLPKEAFALANFDDKRGAIMLQNSKATCKSFAIKRMADYKARIISNTIQGLEIDIDGKVSWFRLIGEFNAYNILGIYSIAVCLEEEPEQILEVLSGLQTARGRFEIIRSANGKTGIIDYAHTPDALENVLDTILSLKSQQSNVVTVVGCGGDRDKTKRPLMAKIACQKSNKVVLTSDNPRTENPETIIKEMKAGIEPTDVSKQLSITDRKEAIRTACMLAQPEDIVLVAGKGHEDYQDVNGVKHPFDDKKVLLEIFNEN